MPNEEAEFGLTYYNSMTTWIDIDRLLDAMGLTRADLEDDQPNRIGGSRDGGAIADLHHAQRRQETLGSCPGRHFSGRPVRETLGRHDGAAGNRLHLPGHGTATRPATEDAGTTRSLEDGMERRITSTRSASGREPNRCADSLRSPCSWQNMGGQHDKKTSFAKQILPTLTLPLTQLSKSAIRCSRASIRSLTDSSRASSWSTALRLSA